MSTSVSQLTLIDAECKRVAADDNSLTLAEVGAFNSIGGGLHHRDALWQVERAGPKASSVARST